MNFPRIRQFLPLILAVFALPLAAADFARPPEKNTRTPRKQEYKLKRNHPAPAPVDAKELAAFPQNGTPRNIIFIIGDGMGQGAQAFASLHAHGAPDKLVMQQMPAAGLAQTFSANSSVTDSAASGTALSSGYKTNNSMIGVNPELKKFRSIAEAAQADGRAVGIMTCDSLAGATPAAFYAHEKHRYMGPEIAAWTVASNFDVLIGNGDRKPFLPKELKGKRADGRNICAELTAKGYLETSKEDALAKAPANSKVFGFMNFPLDDTASLARAAGLVFERLNASPKGFFVMVECAYPDWGGHGNKPDSSAGGVLMTDFLVRQALDFAMKHKDTLVVVTADHETGGISVSPNRDDPKNPHIYYNGTGHSGAPVAVFAFGPGSAFFNGVIDNIDIPRHFSKLWNLKIGLESEIK